MDVLHYKNRIYLVFEFIDFDLKKYLTASKTPLNSLLVKSYMYQIFLAIYYCHSHRVLHRDLKPQNILLDKNGLLKLADFGLARAFGLPMRSYTHQVVTLWYRSPEILLGSKNYGCPVDIWSIGCIYYEMITGKPLFPGDSEIDQLYKIFKILGTPNEQMWPGVSALPEFKTNFPSWNSKDLSSLFVGHANAESDGIDLMNRCLLYDPPKRISAKDAIKHPYFNSLDKTLFGSNGNENSFFS
jgi:serine/threonine protein kinase